MKLRREHSGTILFWSLLGLLLLTFVIFIPEKSHGGDMGHWLRWTGFICTEGLSNIYDYGTVYPTDFPCNYPPVLLYFFKVYSSFFLDIDQMKEGIKYFKIIPLLFDFIGAGAIFLIIKRTWKNSYLPLLLLWSPAFMYNSYCWGQVDTIFTTFVVLALIFALRKQWVLAIIFYWIALNTKMQAIVFLPVVGLAILPLLRSWRNVGLALLVAASTQVLILVPFIINGTIGNWYSVMTSLVDQYQNISLNAFNFWYLLLEGNGALYNKDYQLLWWGLPYKTWGLFFFLFFGFLALLPMLIKSIRYTLENKLADQRFKELVFLSAFLSVLVFFFFNTQMHERYSHPVMLLAFFYGALRKNYWIYLLVSLAYFQNMERVLRFFDLHYHTFIFQQNFIAALFLLALLTGFWHLYRRYPIGEDWKAIRYAFKKIKIN